MSDKLLTLLTCPVSPCDWKLWNDGLHQKRVNSNNVKLLFQECDFFLKSFLENSTFLKKKSKTIIRLCEGVQDCVTLWHGVPLGHQARLVCGPPVSSGKREERERPDISQLLSSFLPSLEQGRDGPCLGPTAGNKRTCKRLCAL